MFEIRTNGLQVFGDWALDGQPHDHYAYICLHEVMVSHLSALILAAMPLIAVNDGLRLLAVNGSRHVLQ